MQRRAWWVAGIALSLLAAGPAQADLDVQDVTFKAGKIKIERQKRVFKPGELIWITFTISGFGHDEVIWLEQNLDVLAPDGSIAYQLQSPRRFKTSWDEELTEAFIENNVQLSRNSPRGEYTAVIKVEDKTTDEKAEFRETFFLGKGARGGGGAGAFNAPAVGAAAGGELTIRDPQLNTGPRGGPRGDNVYKPGQVVHLAFEVGGAAVRKDRMLWIQQDLAVQGPDGAEVFRRNNISGVKQRVKVEVDWITLNNQVKVRRDWPGGNYRLTIFLRDRVAGTTATASTDIYVRK